MTGHVAGWPGAGAVAAMLVGATVLAGCSSGPSTKEEVCSTFDELGVQVFKGNGVFGNPLFHKVDDLSGVASRYADADLSADADALHRIAKADSTSGAEIESATNRIAAVCGHPLGLTALFGGSN